MKRAAAWMARFPRALLPIAAVALAAAHPVVAAPAPLVTLGAHVARYDAAGHLLPWTPWGRALDLEMRFYATAPREHGYPVFVTTTFLDGHWQPIAARQDTIPATQNGMGIISYLKWRRFRGNHDPQLLATARSMGDYILEQDLTPDEGKYPRFPHSTGHRGQFSQPSDSGAQSDHPYEIQPDKGAVAGYALMLLGDATGNARYTDGALHIAEVLATNQRPGDATHSPWPFRADHRTGVARGDMSGDMVYPLRLYDGLIERGHGQFKAPRDALWRWIKSVQIPSAQGDGMAFAQFFEDHDNPANRTAWGPLNLARYLLEKKNALDPDWLADAGTLVAFVRREFTHVEGGVRVCHEQDEDHDAWGGINSTYGAVLAMYAKATHSPSLAAEARDALTFTEYAIDDHGRPMDLPKNQAIGGWQEDAHTDVVHNFVDAMVAYPAWGR